METIVTIALSVLGTLAVVGLFIIPMTNRFAIKRLKMENATTQDIDETHRTMSSEMTHVHERIDDARKDLDYEVENLKRHLEIDIKHNHDLHHELNRYVDSRFDKLEARLQEQINHLMDKAEVPTV